jgi:Protein of unknown function (DUF1460)
MDRRTFLQSISVAALLPSLLLQEKIIANTLLFDPNELICKKKFDFALSLKLTKKPINEVIIEIAKSFLGVEYAADTLEAPGKEQLLINLQTLDCVTFYENSLVLARCIKKNTMTFEDYKNELQFVRYRGGIIDKYPSRLHYTSDYFFDNEKKCVLKNVTKEIGGVPYKKKVNFMSTHADSYLQLRENLEFVKMIAAQEAEINKRTMYYIPKSNLKKAASHINDGDILGITTTIEGLDCTHTGIAIWQNKKLHMIHAPRPGSKVQITEAPLWEYLIKIKKDAGIMVARALEPKV